MDLKLTVISFPKPIDSSNIHPSQWIDIAYIIYENYQQYDGFVVLHGTDTMAYSASAISFLLQGLNKPVIFTGAQLPIGARRTDARENLITSLEIAADKHKNTGLPKVPEVCIYFDYLLMRGNRATKIRSTHFDAFESENYPPLAEAGIHIDYNYSYIKPYQEGDQVKLHRQLDTNVTVIKIFPGMSAANLKAQLGIPGLRGAIIETFGSGNAISEGWFVDGLLEAMDRGIILYNVSQCIRGKVSTGRYQSSKQLHNIGVISGSDITTEAALTKMMFLLANETDLDQMKYQLKTSLAGELT